MKDEDGEVVEEIVIGDMDLPSLLQLWEEHGFVPKLPANNEYMKDYTSFTFKDHTYHFYKTGRTELESTLDNRRNVAREFAEAQELDGEVGSNGFLVLLPDLPCWLANRREATC